ncbi:MAG: amidohydrolase family protein [Verrucomicrobiae bacterium]|nr:amidohydrolase family protein [Verrucomicrobiae bacterium]MCP5539823.1 amidohydrolase family protein [Akkermansiaceae bacterium]
MKRRALLQTAVAGSAAVLLRGRAAKAAAADDGGGDFAGILDSNVSLFRWPFRRLPLDETEKLVAKLRALGVTKALAGSFEGAFHRDLMTANNRLAAECARFPELTPIGTVNPAQPGWERDFDRCVGEHRMAGVRIFPSQQGYALDSTLLGRLLARAAEAGVLVQLAVTLEDPRTQPALVARPEADLGPLPDAMAKAPGARVQLLNPRPSGSQLAALGKTPGLYFDTARADGTDGVASLLAATGPDRVLFGSHAPFLIPEAALIRVHESALDPGPLRAVLRDNAERLLA